MAAAADSTRTTSREYRQPFPPLWKSFLLLREGPTRRAFLPPPPLPFSSSIRSFPAALIEFLLLRRYFLPSSSLSQDRLAIKMLSRSKNRSQARNRFLCIFNLDSASLTIAPFIATREKTTYIADKRMYFLSISLSNIFRYVLIFVLRIQRDRYFLSSNYKTINLARKQLNLQLILKGETSASEFILLQENRQNQHVILENAGTTAGDKNLCLCIRYRGIIPTCLDPFVANFRCPRHKYFRGYPRAQLGANRRDKNDNIQASGLATAARYP